MSSTVPDSMKVDLGIGQLPTGKLLFAGHSEANHCSGFRMPNCHDQLPKQPLLSKVYIAVDFQSQGHFFGGNFIVHEHYFPKLLLRIVVFVVD